MSVTIKDVARKADVSPSTVSRVLSNHPRISAATARKVREIMEEMGYHPNLMAKSLVSKTTKSICVILPKPAEELFLNLFFMELIRGIVAQAARSGYDVLISSGASEAEEVEAVARLVNGRRVDGAVLLYSRKDDPVVEFLKQREFPFVLVGRSERYPDILSVDTDNVQAAYDAARHLISLGHERIGFVGGPPNMVVSMDRMQGYRRALEEAGLPLREDWIVEGEFLQDSGYRAMSMLMSLPERPSGMLVVDDFVTFGVIRGLNELGYRIPQDLSIVSFNNLALAELSSPPISSVDIGSYHLGYTASQTLIRAVETPREEQTSVRHIIPHRLIVRESSLFAPVRKA
ncbi:LacI family DNA-binding transcriptional regulator [Saccharibacillus qingshengii]|uniref:LacI family DNA-binding transcriptional regulator n=1 Tax=Saccharibacillus qingshengii TaxID=1763540 RepID=UPI001552C762|nr:LacI family DNA-binding transcriptional regulator [Saccharibacillus qingshengii]